MNSLRYKIQPPSSSNILVGEQSLTIHPSDLATMALQSGHAPNPPVSTDKAERVANARRGGREYCIEYTFVRCTSCFGFVGLWREFGVDWETSTPPVWG